MSLKTRHIFLFFSFLLAQKSIASCELPQDHEVKVCKGTFKASTLEQVETYQMNYGLKKDHYRHLVLSGSLEGENLSISSPCRIKVKEGSSIKLSGDLCLNAKEGIHINKHFELNANDVELTSTKKVVIRNNASIKAKNIFLTSTGEFDNSRVHIRHTSKIEAKSLILKGHHRATLGHSSTYDVTDSVSLEAKGYEHATVWKNTTVNTKSFSIDSSEKLKISKGVVINAESVSLNCKECKIPKKATINATYTYGDAFKGQAPVASFVSDIEIGNTPLDVRFDATSSWDNDQIVEYVFSVDGVEVQRSSDAAFSYTFLEPKEYIVTLVVKDSEGLESEFFSKSIIAEASNNATPIATFDCYQGSNQVGCWSTSTDIDGEIVSTKFEISNGDKFDAPSFGPYFFQETGVFTVTMTIVDDMGAVVTASREFTILPNHPPGSDFNCNVWGMRLECWSNSNDPDGWVTDARFEISDGTTIPGYYFDNHIFNVPGEHEIKHIVKDNSGVTTSTMKVYVSYINQPPVANFECGQFQSNLNCWSLAEDIDGYPALGKFELSNGEVIEGWHFDRSNLTQGELTVTFTVMDNLGAQSSLSKTYSIGGGEINIPPVAEISCEIIEPTRFYCYSNDYDEDGYVDRWEWRANGNLISTDSSFERFDFEVNKDYLIELIVYDNLGLVSESVSTTLRSNNLPPVAEFYFMDQGNGEVRLTSASSDPENSFLYYSWFVDDVEVGGGSEIFLRVTPNRDYKVKLVVTDEVSLSSEKVEIVRIVNELPVSKIRYENLDNKNIRFYSESSDSDGYISSYEWSVDGIVVSNSSEFDLRFDHNKEYVVSLKVVDDKGETAISFVSVKIDAFIPVAGFDCDEFTLDAIKCLSSSTIADNSNLSYEWYVSGELWSRSPDFIYSYSEDRDIEIKLVVTSEHQISSEIKKDFSLKVNRKPVIDKVSCTQTNNILIDCKIVVSDDGEIQSLFWSTSTAESGHSSVFSLQLSGFEPIEIYVTVTDDVGYTTNFTYEYQPINLELTPQAGFMWMYEYGGNLVLNAAPSLAEYRGVSKYEWFIDGQKIDEEGFIVEIPNKTNPTYRVKLRVTDTLNRVDEVERSINHYVMPVAEPSYELNAQSLLGVDSDSDGMNDFVQRYNLVYAEGNSNLLVHLNKLGEVQFQIFSKIKNEQEFTSEYSKKLKVLRCIDTFEDVDSRDISENVEALLSMSKEGLERLLKSRLLSPRGVQLEDTDNPCTY